MSHRAIRKAHSLVIVLGLLSHLMACASESGKPDSENTLAYTLWYSAQMGEHERNSLTIDAEGNVTGHIQQAQTGSAPRALGWYYLPAGPDDADIVRIGELIRTQNLVGGEPHGLTPRPGMRTKVVVLTLDGQETSHLLDAMAPPPDELAELEATVNNLFGRVASTPLRTFEMAITLSPERIQPGEDLRIQLDFRNEGRFPTQFRSPATFAAGGADALRINLWRAGNEEAGEESLEFETMLDLAGFEFLVDERRALPSREPFAKIPANGSLRIWTTLRLPKLDPNDYVVEAFYYGHTLERGEQESNHDLLVGEYHAELRSLTVDAGGTKTSP